MKIGTKIVIGIVIGVGLKAKKSFRVRRLINPSRLVIDFKH